MKILTGYSYVRLWICIMASVILLLTSFYMKHFNANRSELTPLSIQLSSRDILGNVDITDTSKSFKYLKSETPSSNPSPASQENGYRLIDHRIADEVSRKVRLLCWIPSREKYLKTRLKAVNSTWARRCDKTIYFMTNISEIYPGVISVDIPDGRNTLTDKTVFALTYIYKHYMQQFDWFYKADDDTYVIVENLKFMLSHFNSTIPGYVGCQFKHFAPQGYMSGGAGYALNSLGIKDIVEKGYNIPGRCRLSGGAEDIETGRCAYKAGIATLNQLDILGKQTFFASNVYAYALGPIPSWAASYTRASVETGFACCSPLLISFHYTGEKLMYATDFLLYQVVIHGRLERIDIADGIFNGTVAKDMSLNERRRPYPGETLEEYYQKGWRDKNTTIYINPNV